MRVAFIGLGRRSTGHLRRVHAMEGVEIVGVCDLLSDLAETRAKEFGSRAFTDARTMLAQTDAEAAIVTLPPFAHGDAEDACLEAKVPFLLEKPVHLDISAARRIADRVAAQGLVTSVGYQERYLDIVERLEEAVRGRRVGVVFGHWMGGSPGGWWVRRDRSGGQAVEQTTHVFDLARHLFGPARRVFASGVRGILPPDGGRDIEDASAATIEFANGVVAVITSACYLQVRELVPAGLEVFCQDANIRYVRRRSLTVATASGSETWTVANDSETAMLADFLHAARAGDPKAVRCSYTAGVEAVELSLAVNRALETGAPVSLPL